MKNTTTKTNNTPKTARDFDITQSMTVTSVLEKAVDRLLNCDGVNCGDGNGTKKINAMIDTIEKILDEFNGGPIPWCAVDDLFYNADRIYNLLRMYMADYEDVKSVICPSIKLKKSYEVGGKTYTKKSTNEIDFELAKSGKEVIILLFKPWDNVKQIYDVSHPDSFYTFENDVDVFSYDGKNGVFRSKLSKTSVCTDYIKAGVDRDPKDKNALKIAVYTVA